MAPRAYWPIGKLVRGANSAGVIGAISWYATLGVPVVLFSNGADDSDNLALIRNSISPSDIASEMSRSDDP